MNTDEIVGNVKSWYGDIKNWPATDTPGVHKTPSCTDWTLLEQGELVKGKDVLNIGCYYPGDEEQFGHLAKSWTAIDFSPEVITRCQALPPLNSVRFLLEDARKMSFPDESFDLVLDFSSGDQMPEAHYDEALKEIYRVLRPGGLFIVTYASFEFFQTKEVHGDYGYSRCYSAAELKAKLSRFEIIKETTEVVDRAGFVCQKKNQF